MDLLWFSIRAGLEQWALKDFCGVFRQWPDALFLLFYKRKNSVGKKNNNNKVF